MKGVIAPRGHSLYGWDIFWPNGERVATSHHAYPSAYMARKALVGFLLVLRTEGCTISVQLAHEQPLQKDGQPQASTVNRLTV